MPRELRGFVGFLRDMLVELRRRYTDTDLYSEYTCRERGYYMPFDQWCREHSDVQHASMSRELRGFVGFLRFMLEDLWRRYTDADLYREYACRE